MEHLPLLVDLRPLPLAIPWTAPRPRLPPLLQQAPSELRKSKDWAELVEQWQNTPAYRTFLALPTSSPAQEISYTLSTALEALVDLAGGGNSAPLHPAQHMSPQRFDGSAGPCDFWEKYVPW